MRLMVDLHSALVPGPAGPRIVQILRTFSGRDNVRRERLPLAALRAPVDEPPVLQGSGVIGAGVGGIEGGVRVSIAVW
jgi:hypothetical protein